MTMSMSVNFHEQVSEEETRTDGICLEPIKQTDAAQFQSWTTGFEYQVGHRRHDGVDGHRQGGVDHQCLDHLHRHHLHREHNNQRS